MYDLVYCVCACVREAVAAAGQNFWSSKPTITPGENQTPVSAMLYLLI